MSTWETVYQSKKNLWPFEITLYDPEKSQSVKTERFPIGREIFILSIDNFSSVKNFLGVVDKFSSVEN